MQIILSTLPKILTLAFALTTSLVVTNPALSHPTSARGTTIIDTKFNNLMSEMGLGYSFHTQWALWLRTMTSPQSHPSPHSPLINFVQINHLVKRWNQKESQGNLYLGAGLEYGQPLRSRTSSLGYLQADWETRHIYTMLEYQTWTQPMPSTESIKFRLGVAPYLVDFDKQSAWIILESQTLNRQDWELRTLLRLYFQNILWEMGGSLNGNVLINIMSHF